MTEPHPSGTRVKVTGRDQPKSLHDAHVGREYLVESYVSAEESDVELGDGEHQAFYWLVTLEGDADASAAAEHVEHVMSGAEHRAAAIMPTLDQIVAAIGFGLMVDGDGFRVDETDKGGEPTPGTHVVNCYGLTDNGVRFRYDVTIGGLERSL